MAETFKHMGNYIMKIIIYGSQYGTARRYAEELSKRTGIEAVNYSDIEDINKYDTVIYFGALYAGSVLGIKKTLNKLRDINNKKVIIASVGLADPNDEENREGIKENIKDQIYDCIYYRSKIFFLRGAIDYSNLSLKHKTMMAFIHRKVKGMKEEEKTAEIRAVVKTYGKKVDYVDFDALNPIVDEIL